MNEGWHLAKVKVIPPYDQDIPFLNPYPHQVRSRLYLEPIR